MTKLEDIFTITYGVNLELNKLNEVESNGVPFVSRTDKNNGISAYVSSIHGVSPNPANTISVALTGTVLESFYQPNEYYSGILLMDGNIVAKQKPH